ncbi:MAG: 50S ribosomal protein L33 [Alphaproteobacteria bacterium]
MAKKDLINIRLVSDAGTGFFYITTKNPKKKPEKLELRKYDPKLGKHTMFKEKKEKNS